MWCEPILHKEGAGEDGVTLVQQFEFKVIQPYILQFWFGRTQV